MKKLVYTVITNNNICLCDINHEKNCDYICFTTNKYLKSDTWKIVIIKPDKDNDNRLLEIKTKYLLDENITKNYDLCIYIKYNYEVTIPINELVEKNYDIKSNNLVFTKNKDIIRDIFFIRNNNKESKTILEKIYNSIKNSIKEEQICLNEILKDNKKVQIIDIMNNLKFRDVDYSFSMGNLKDSSLGNPSLVNQYDVEEMCNINDENDSHSMLARQVKSNSTVLDVGCATGIMGKLLKDAKKCTVDGIEPDSVAFNKAKERKIYRNIYNMLVSNNDEKFINLLKDNIKYDYILLADVLEHTQDPVEIINLLSNLLNENGKILVSVPNISHVDIIKGLFNQQFNYNDVGILDNTHLRFFTSNSFIDMINNYNKRYDNCFMLKYVGSTYLEPAYKDKYYILKYFDKKYFIVQNMYELTLTTKDKCQIIQKNDIEFFDDFNEEIRNLELEKIKLQHDCDEYKNECEVYKKECERLNKELEQLHNDNIILRKDSSFINKEIKILKSSKIVQNMKKSNNDKEENK